MAAINQGLVFAAIFTFFLFHSRAATPPSSLVQELCNSVGQAGCVEALTKDPRTATADLRGLAHISIELAISNATDGQTFIENLVKTSPQFKAPLEKCVSWYDAAIHSFQSALLELEEDVMTANYDVKIAGDDADACETELTSSKAQLPSVTTRNNYVKLYSIISYWVTDRLQ